MDISAKISLILSIVEFVAAAWLYFKFDHSKLLSLIVGILIMLGLSHLSEYEFCSFGNFQLWGKVSFIAYMLIPTLIVFYGFQEVLNKKTYLLFIPYLGFAIPALLMKNFSTLGKCESGFSLFYNYFYFSSDSIIPSIINYCYIGIYSFLGAMILFYGAKLNLTGKRIIYILIGSSLLVSFLVPTLISISYPPLGMYYPSIITRFLASYLITGTVSLYLEKKLLDISKQKNLSF